MLISMTGHGQSLVQNSDVRVLAEVRTVNGRFLKTNIHSDLNVNRQSQLEDVLKRFINRGSVSLKIKTERLKRSDHWQLNEGVIRAYWLQLSEIAGNSQHINVESLLQLPGVVQEAVDEDDSDLWPVVEVATQEALEQLMEMRKREGAVMQQNMLQNCQEIESNVAKIESLAPQVVASYSQRLADRIKKLLQEQDAQAEPSDIIREVGFFAERVDTSEEIVRLNCHLQQFREIVELPESNGRKLDFLVQEMLRETNTIGSKASDAGIAAAVVDIKTAIERIREMVQNVE